MSNRRRGRRGQALVELGISLPVIIVIAFVAGDLGRAFYYRLPVAAMASAGARLGATANTGDVGSAVRIQTGAVPNTAAVWGQAYTSGSTNGSDSDCSNSNVSSQRCGDPSGCVPNSSFWSTPGPGVTSGANPIACFAMRSCTVNTGGSSAHDGQCTAPTGCTSATGAWQIRPLAASSQSSPPCLAALQVTVVYRFVASTPVVAAFFSGPGHSLFETATATSVEEY